MENLKFNIIYPPGFEDLGERELKEKWPLYFNSPLPEVERQKGVLSLDLSYNEGVSLNAILKIPSKIHLEIATFKCRDLPKLYNKVQKIDFSPYLYSESPLFHVTSKKSRLINTTKIENTLKDAFESYFKSHHLKTKTIEEYKDHPRQELHFRFIDDTLTISLNTSGNLLYKRGDNEYRGLASLRENYASALVYLLSKNSTSKILVDPMCGSGSFLKEANFFYSLNNGPFGFKGKIELAKNLNHQLFDQYHGRDILEENVKNLNEYNAKKDNVFSPKEAIPEASVIINAPYGKRIKLDSPPEIYYPKLIKSIFIHYKPTSFLILIPKPIKTLEVTIFRMGFKKALSFSNNGIDVCAYLYKL